VSLHDFLKEYIGPRVTKTHSFVWICFLGSMFSFSQVYFPWNITLVTMANCMFVLVYWLMLDWSISTGAETISTDDFTKWADTIYFFEFLMTLVSLICALGGANTSGGSDLILKTVAQNAIALSSTVAGLFIRTLWLLVQDVESEDEEPLSLETEIFALQKSVKVLRKSVLSSANGLNAAMSDLVEFQEKSVRTVSENLNIFGIDVFEIGKTISIDLKNQLSTFTVAADGLRSKIEKIELDKDILARNISSATISVMSELYSGIDQLEQPLVKAAESIGASVGELSYSIESVSFDDIIRRQLEKSLEPITQLSEQVILSQTALVKNLDSSVNTTSIKSAELEMLSVEQINNLKVINESVLKKLKH
jgi:hypothetical protein